MVVRDNHATGITGMNFRTKYNERVAGQTELVPWTIRHAGVVFERNLCTDSVVGIVIDEDAAVTLRGNESRNVRWPLTRVVRAKGQAVSTV
jgi:hypothetical protein